MQSAASAACSGTGCCPPKNRTNATALIIFRLRNVNEHEALTVENSADVSRDRFKQIYDEATSEPYNFLYANTTAKSIDETFYLRFEHPIVP